METLQKHSINFVLLVLVFSLLFTPLIPAKANYSTGYLDLNLKKKLTTDLAFFLQDNIQKDIVFKAKYDSKTLKNSKANYKEDYLDDSTLITDLSEQKEYFKLHNRKYSLMYGKYNFEVKNPLFSDYYNQYSGLKFKKKGKKNSFNAFLSKSKQISKTDKVINPNYSVIFLSSRNIVKDSERLYLNVVNEDNEIIQIVALMKSKDYNINYLQGRIEFNPLIFFLNNHEHDYELIINYKIKGDSLDYYDKGFNLSTNFFKNTKLKLYEVNEKDKRTFKGSSLKYSPTQDQEYILSYQRYKNNDRNAKISIDNGQKFYEDPAAVNIEEKKGVRFSKKFNNSLLKGHSYQQILARKNKRYRENEYQLKLNSALSKKIKSNLSYKKQSNSINQSGYDYKAALTTQLSPKLKLDTIYRHELKYLDQTNIKSLDNFFELKYSENLDIYWGCLHNLTNESCYHQYGFDYLTNSQNKITYRIKAEHAGYRIKNYKYIHQNRLELFKRLKEKLKNEKVIKRSQGLKYRFKNKNILSIIKNEYSQSEKSIENIVKYQFQMSSNLTTGLNLLEYYTQPLLTKRDGIRGYLNYKTGKHKLNVQYEKTTGNLNLYQKKRTNLSYEKHFDFGLKVSTSLKINTELDKSKNIKEMNEEMFFKIIYRPLNKDYRFRYQYDKQEQFNQNNKMREKNKSTKHSLNLIYKLNKKLSFNTNLAQYKTEQKIKQNNLKNKIGLYRLGIDYKLNKKYLLNLEYRKLMERLSYKKDSGFLVGLRRNINDNLSLGLEYNFTDFGNDIKQIDDEAKGLSFNLNYRW